MTDCKGAERGVVSPLLVSDREALGGNGIESQMGGYVLVLWCSNDNGRLLQIYFVSCNLEMIYHSSICLCHTPYGIK